MAETQYIISGIDGFKAIAGLLSDDHALTIDQVICLFALANKLLGHVNVKITQGYAKIIDKKLSTCRFRSLTEKERRCRQPRRQHL